MQRIAVNGPFDESNLSRPFSSLTEAYQALLLENFHTNKRKGIYQLVSCKNVCKVVCMGDRGEIGWDKRRKRFVSEGTPCSYRAHIRRVTKKGEAPHYIIDGNSNFEHSDDCRLRNCRRNTTTSKLRLSSVISR